MLAYFGELASLLRVDPISIDNKVFKLHYKFTASILVLFSVSITIKQQFGEPIVCLPDIGEVKKSDEYYKAIDSYCWTSNTYTVNELLNGEVGVSVLAPGVGQFTGSEKTTIHKYYQWVGLVLFIQAIAFYAPHFLWIVWDNGKMKMISKDLMSAALDEDIQATARKNLKFYFMGHLGYQNLYFFRFVFCEILNFVNIITQIILTDIFLGHEFTNYGKSVFSFNKYDKRQVWPTDKVFPKITKCQFNNYGPSGNIIPNDIICVMPLNKINEYVYVVLWFWFITVACFSAAGLIFRSAVILFPSIRSLLLSRRTVWTMNDRARLDYIVSELHLGDWFVLYQLGRNIDKLAFNEFIKDVANGLEERTDQIEENERTAWLSTMNIPRLSITSTKQFPQAGKLSDTLLR